ncbi:MAG TPA: hypothetical protein PLO51_05680, partial [Candidatus Micrarchaeota archaeon]|nr:hypothetical protein [Candidatus Micrarchaeota archaeon]
RVGTFPFNFGSKWECSIPNMGDWLLAYLNNKHSAAIVITDDLPSYARTEDKFMSRIVDVSAACPNCLQALHYPPGYVPMPMKNVREAPYNYPDDLNEQIKIFSGLPVPAQPLQAKEVEFDINRTTMPDDWLRNFFGKVPRPVSDIQILVIDIDLSTVDMTSNETIDSDISALTNMSRRVLQHVGWPTVWKLDFLRNSAGAYNSDMLYKRLYLHQRDMTLAGVAGIILPPLDYGNPPEKYSTPKFSDPTPGIMLSPGQTVSTPDTPFCAAQNGSNTFLHPKITAGIQKIVAKDKCFCKPCSDMEITLGRCTPDLLACEDGSACTQTGDPPYGPSKCEPYCVLRDCEVCNSTTMGTKKVTCSALRSDNSPPRQCAGPLGPWEYFP